MYNAFLGDIGHFFVITAFVTSVFSSFCYYKTTTVNSFDSALQWKNNARVLFFMHSFSVLGIVFCLFYIIYNHHFEYHYAWAHSSKRLPTHYMISCFWEGQEGSFLLWMFWHSILGMIVIMTNKFWESSVMTFFIGIQSFLSSMILGVVIPYLDIKLGSSPFILLREVIDAPIFSLKENFVPEDGTGLNPLLQNYWMVIHPPTLFLGFAATIVPFAYCLSGLWLGRFKEWIVPALPWTLFSVAVLGLGIFMGAYWAYETLSFGGYWNWDPVENAVYVPWLFLIASIHLMIVYRKSKSTLKSSMILIIISYILILYSTFLTRSGILGDASVHSFTDLGLSGQLLVYLLFFIFLSFFLVWKNWNNIPKSEKEVKTYSREFWMFIGSISLCFMGFQVLLPTSIPVFNATVEAFGSTSNIAPPANQIEFYSDFQVWFAVLISFLSAITQYVLWKEDKFLTIKEKLIPIVVITFVLSTVFILISNIDNPTYIVLLLAGIFTIVANANIFLKMWKKNLLKSGGAVSHIGIGFMLIGILFSSGYSKIISKNSNGVLISKNASFEFNNENILLFVNEPKIMDEYELKYKGERVFSRKEGVYVDKNEITGTAVPQLVVLKNRYFADDVQIFKKLDTIEINPENTYFEIEFSTPKDTFSLFPRAQINESMGGLLASPDIKNNLGSDLYVHISSVRNPTEEIEWNEAEIHKVAIDEVFFINDYVAKLKKIIPLDVVEGIKLEKEDVAIKAFINFQGEEKEYTATPIFVIKNGKVGIIEDEINDLALKVSLSNIHPEEQRFTIVSNTRQKNWVVIKAIQMPQINLLWLGILILMIGLFLAMFNRYVDFKNQANVFS